MEHLYACCLLWTLGFATKETYADSLHSFFLENPESSTLFALEESFPDAAHNLFLLEKACVCESSAFSRAAFANALFTSLRAVYNENHFSLPVFGKKCYTLWKTLPAFLRYEEPFHALEYAQDSLAWGDEYGMRAHLERAFADACQ